MGDVIRLLPEHVANQIAAGEVIQRPASVLKELLENALDAGSTRVEVWATDGGKTSIRVADNGVGMTEADARMAWERHATSKIARADDLYALRTMGFRGEALASIASVARVDMLTRRATSDVATHIVMEGSKLLIQEPAQADVGTSITVKNLFYNIPARRQFLKSTPVESRHVHDEFVRVALARPDVAMNLSLNGKQVFQLPKQTLEERLTGIFPEIKASQWMSCSEETPVINISGYVAAPQTARKSRGEQFFFVNQRFFRDPFLHHAVKAAFEGLIPDDAFPVYSLHFEVDPAKIDVNVHPAKTEVKFGDDKIIYQLLKSAVRKALGGFAPVELPDFHPSILERHPDSLPRFTPLPGGSNLQPLPSLSRPSSSGDWKKVFDPFLSAPGLDDAIGRPAAITDESAALSSSHPTTDSSQPVFLADRYILIPMRQAAVLIDAQVASQRVLFEQFMAKGQQRMATQEKLFPKVMEFNAADFSILEEMLPYLQEMGFDAAPFGKQAVTFYGLPANISEGNEEWLIRQVIDQFRKTGYAEPLPLKEQLARQLAIQAAYKPGQIIRVDEMRRLADALFGCMMPAIGPDGRPTFRQVDASLWAKMLSGL